MAKRFDNNKNNKKLERAITRNWIIMGISLAAIIVLYIVASHS